MRAKLRCCHRLHRHQAPKNTLDRNLLVELQLAPGVVNCGASAHTCAGWRTINFAVGKDANVAAVVTGIERRSGEDRPVKKTQILFKRMLDREVRYDCLLDAPAIIDEPCVVICYQTKA